MNSNCVIVNKIYSRRTFCTIVICKRNPNNIYRIILCFLLRNISKVITIATPMSIFIYKVIYTSIISCYKSNK
nr:MAG TPA: hypothetical protein [Caudoviricetes sp.]